MHYSPCILFMYKFKTHLVILQGIVHEKRSLHVKCVIITLEDFMRMLLIFHITGKKWLPPDVYRYHELVCKEVNAPVEL